MTSEGVGLIGRLLFQRGLPDWRGNEWRAAINHRFMVCLIHVTA
jgi:hypothetical protein